MKCAADILEGGVFNRVGGGKNKKCYFDNDKGGGQDYSNRG